MLAVRAGTLDSTGVRTEPIHASEHWNSRELVLAARNEREPESHRLSGAGDSSGESLNGIPIAGLLESHRSNFLRISQQSAYGSGRFTQATSGSSRKSVTLRPC
jgi:hypothetical protein